MHVGLLAHGVPPRLVAEELTDLAGQGRGIFEGNQHAPPVGQQLFGVPVRRRDDGLAAAERVGQRARGDLRGVEVGRDVNVGHADEFDQLVDLDEPVEKADVLLDAQVLGQPLEADPIAFPLLAEEVGMRCAQHDVNEVGILLEDRRHGAEHVLDPLVRRQQAERQGDILALDVELILVELGIDKRHVGDAMGDQIDLGVGYLVDLSQERAALVPSSRPPGPTGRPTWQSTRRWSSVGSLTTV